jgi:hypothetical protein
MIKDSSIAASKGHSQSREPENLEAILSLIVNYDYYSIYLERYRTVKRYVAEEK